AEPLPAASERERGSVGFYFFEDRDAAAAVQAAVPLPLDAPGLLPLTHGEMLPGPGTIDVFIADDRKGTFGTRTH
ncbi:MAG: hypothetical protein JOZ42_17835, partial [Acetobacteraceae bacterium]|nr:hypothetical protein [Acetobacteraceae bacterium]